MASNPFDTAHMMPPNNEPQHRSASDMRHMTAEVSSLSLEQQYALQYRQQLLLSEKQFALPSGPAWAPIQPSPTALLAPRGRWLRQMEQQRLIAATGGYTNNCAPSSMSPTSSVALMTRQTQQMHLGGGHGGFKQPAVYQQVSSECVPATPITPSVRITPAEEHSTAQPADPSKQLDKIASDLAAMAAASASISPANFISDEILDMPTMDFKNFLTSGGFDDATIVAFKAARRRKKNRIYAKGSRDRKDRRNSPSTQRSRSVSPAARNNPKQPATSPQNLQGHSTGGAAPQNVAVKMEEAPTQSLLDKYVDAERGASQHSGTLL
eukprot:m.65203 g.65203  ORF g.65203 m.65203 type:complete len:324 (-) comp15910_c0_seq3:183-1154(-)